MTEPLVDRNELSRVAYHVMSETDGYFTAGMMSDAVLAYLRSVLTPEVLRPNPDLDMPHNIGAGESLHRRIFGEDK